MPVLHSSLIFMIGQILFMMRKWTKIFLRLEFSE